MPLSLNTVGVTPTDITATPAPATIPSHVSFSTIPTHVTAGTNNGSENDISDGILEIVQMGSIPADIVALSCLREKNHNALSPAQVSLQEGVAVSGIPNTLSVTSDPSLMELSDRTINELLRRL